MRTRLFLGGLVLVFLATFWLGDSLRFEPAGDEKHFLSSAELFQGRFELEALRSYPEVVTPLALVIWGELHYLTGDGLYYGRLLNFVLTVVMVGLVAFCAPGNPTRAALAAVGLLLFPYTLALATHLYTDTIGVFLGVCGALALSRGRAVLGWFAFVCAIATRQYLVQIPAAIAAVEGMRWLRGERVRWPVVIACAASSVTVLGWLTFFRGLATQAGIDFWTPHYPAPMLHATEFILFHGLYALTGIGAYFVLVEALLFRRAPVPPEMRSWRGLGLALALAGLFWLDPPLLSNTHTGGPIGRAAIELWPAPQFDWARLSIYYVLALLCVLRFAGRLDIGFWLVAAAFVLATKQQLPWEKYLFPTIGALWTMVALGELSGHRGRDAATRDGENSFTKQPLPSPGFNT
jgi:hypothetical protein